MLKDHYWCEGLYTKLLSISPSSKEKTSHLYFEKANLIATVFAGKETTDKTKWYMSSNT